MQDEELPRAFGGFTLLALQGSGASGNVYLARARGASPSPLVVVKAMHPSIVGDEVLLRRFEHEALISVAIDSPHVARVLEVGTIGDQPYIAMERVEGWTLSALMTAAREDQRALPAALVAAWVCDALRGLQALHAAVHPKTREPLSAVHRDISPKNLMVGADLVLRVIDFGLGTSSAQDWATRVGAALGTHGYAAPEQRGGARIDPRADLYSLGVVAWELLALRRFAEEGRAPAWRSVGRADVPRGLEAALARAVDPAPSARFGSAEEMLDAVEPFTSGVREPSVIPPRLRDALDRVEEASHAWATDTATDPGELEPTRVLARRDDITDAPGEVTQAPSTSLEVTHAVSPPRGAPVQGADGRRALAPAPRAAASAFAEVRVDAAARTQVLGEALSSDAHVKPPRLGLAARGLAVVAAVAAGVVLAVGLVPRDRPVLVEPFAATATNAGGPIAAVGEAPAIGAIAPPSPRVIGAVAATSSVGGEAGASPAAISPGSPAALVEAPSLAEAPSLGRAPSSSPPIAPSSSPPIAPSLSAPIAPALASPARAASPASPIASPPASSAARPSPGDHPASSSAPPSPPAPSAPATPEEALRALVEQAQRLRRAHPEHGAAIDELLTDATLWSRSRDTSRAMAMLAEQARRLAALSEAE